MNLTLIRKLDAIPEETLAEVLKELTEKDESTRILVEKYVKSTTQLELPKPHEMKAIISQVTKEAREVLRTKELEPYELPILKERLIAVIDLWFESIFHKRCYEKLLILSGLITTYNYDPFSESFLFPGIEMEVNLRIKRFLETLSSPERKDFFYTILELIESSLYPRDLGGPAAFLSKVLGQLESSNLNYDQDLLNFYDDYFGDIKESLILSGDLSYLPLFVHYCHLVKIYRNDEVYQDVLYRSRFLRELMDLKSFYKYYPEDWEKEHLKKLLSYPLYKKVVSSEKDIRESILNFDNYIQENDLNDTFAFLKQKR